MDLNWILLWMSGVSTAINFVMSLQNRQAPVWGWRAVLTILLLLLAGTWLTIPQQAGYIVAPLWFVFVLLPGLLLRRVNQLLSQRKHRRAYWAGRLAGWLHPFDGWPQQTQLVRALALFEQGETGAASAVIARLGTLNSSLGRTARLIQAQQTGNWQQLLDWINAHCSDKTVFADETLLIARTQALGELGRPKDMLRVVGTLLAGHVRISPVSRAVLRMRAAALAGQVAATQRQLASLTQTYPEDVRSYWALTARQVAGDEHAADGFRRLQESASPYLRPMIQRRLAHPLPKFGEASMDAEDRLIVEALADRIEHDSNLSVWNEESTQRPWATWAIAAGLVANFLREIPGGSLDLDNLIELGALIIPQSMTPGEWWRVLTAGFLHFGPIHLALNLLGLLALAPRLERSWGRLPMIVCYLVATFTSMALAPHVMRLDPQGPPLRILVGASGGMMGLLGGLVGYMLIGWLRHRNEHTQRPLVFLLMIVILQTAFDLSTPSVSLACHTLGLATGAVFGIAWTWMTQQRRDA